MPMCHAHKRYLLILICPLFSLWSTDDQIRAPRVPVNDPPAVNVLDTPVLRDLDVPRDLYVQGTLYVGGDFIASGTIPGGGGGGGGGGDGTGSPLIVNATAGNDSYIIFEENGVERGRIGAETGSDNFFMSVDGGTTNAFSMGSDASAVAAHDFTVATDLFVTQSVRATTLLINNGGGTSSVANPALTRGIGITGYLGNTACLALDTAGTTLYTSFIGRYDVTNPQNLVLLNSSAYSALGLAYHDGVLIATDGSGNLRTINATTLVERDSLNIPGGLLYSIAVIESGLTVYALVVDINNNALYAVDITDPDAIALVQTLSIPNSPQAVAAHDASTAFVVTINDDLLHAIDVSALPGAMSEISAASSLTSPAAVAIQGTNVYIASSSGAGFQSFDVSNPAAMVPLATVGSVACCGAGSIAIMGTAAYVTDLGITQDLFVYEISNPAAPTLVAQVPALADPCPVVAANDYIFVAAATNLHLYTDVLQTPDVGLSVIGTATVQGDLFVGRDNLILFVSSSDNRVGINTGSPAAPYALDVAGTCNATDFSVSSDMRLKEHIQPIQNASEKLSKIRGVTFDWNSTQCAMGRSTGKREIGVIAQEVEAQFPELITYWQQPNATTVYRAVDYDRLNAVILEVVNEHTRALDVDIRHLALVCDLVATYTNDGRQGEGS